MNVLHVWLGPSEHDSLIHYWYEARGNILSRRTSDGKAGFLAVEGDRREICSVCEEVYWADLRWGGSYSNSLSLDLRDNGEQPPDVMKL